MKNVDEQLDLLHKPIVIWCKSHPKLMLASFVMLIFLVLYCLDIEPNNISLGPLGYDLSNAPEDAVNRANASIPSRTNYQTAIGNFAPVLQISGDLKAPLVNVNGNLNINQEAQYFWTNRDNWRTTATTTDKGIQYTLLFQSSSIIQPKVLCVIVKTDVVINGLALKGDYTDYGINYPVFSGYGGHNNIASCVEPILRGLNFAYVTLEEQPQNIDVILENNPWDNPNFAFIVPRPYVPNL